MSLFKSRELWSTLCGKDEHFDNGCMVVSDILSNGFDCIIVGSHCGFLRIYQRQNDFESDDTGYKPTDLLIEAQLPHPVIQVAVGKLISGSQRLHVGVLHPRSVAVYSLVTTAGSAQHGDQYQLLLAYEHQLARSAFSFVVGSFGGVKGTQGLVALLSDDGQIVCCYMGTEPAVFVAPPLSNRALSYDDLQLKLVTLQEEIDTASETAAVQVSEGHELSVSARTLALTDPSECQLLVQLSPSTALNNVQITVTVTPPLTVAPSTHHLPSLCETVEVSCLVTFLPTHIVPVLSVDLHVVVAYASNNNNPRVLQTTAALPLSLVLQPTGPSRDAEHKITLTLSQPIIPLNQLFPELIGDEWQASGCSESVAGLAHRWAPHQPTTIVISKGSPRYRVQGDTLAAACLVITQLTTRLETHYAARHKPVTISYSGCNLPLTPLLAAVDRHVELRNTIKDLLEKLGHQTTQYRAIQRRLLSKLREKTVLPLVGLDRILSDTYQLIATTSHNIEETTLALEVCSCELGCLVRLLLTLARLCDTKSLKDWTDLAAAMSYVLHSTENQGWEEVCEPGVNYLLSTSLAKTVRDHQRTAVDPLTDSARFKKHIAVALDRVVAGTSVRLKDEPRGVSPIDEGEEDSSSVPKTSRGENLATLKLLTAREELHTYVETSTQEERTDGRDEAGDETIW